MVNRVVLTLKALCLLSMLGLALADQKRSGCDSCGTCSAQHRCHTPEHAECCAEYYGHLTNKRSENGRFHNFMEFLKRAFSESAEKRDNGGYDDFMSFLKKRVPEDSNTEKRDHSGYDSFMSFLRKRLPESSGKRYKGYDDVMGFIRKRYTKEPTILHKRETPQPQ